MCSPFIVGVIVVFLLCSSRWPESNSLNKRTLFSFFSWDEKKQKAQHASKISCSPLLFVNCPMGNITHSWLACRYKPFCCTQGAAELVSCDNVRKNIVALHSNIFTSRNLGYTRHSINKLILCTRLHKFSHNGLLPTGLFAVILTVLHIIEITLAMGYSYRRGEPMCSPKTLIRHKNRAHW